MENLISRQKEHSQCFFITTINEWIIRLRQEKHFGQALRTKSTRNSFSRFLRSQGSEDIKICNLSADIVHAYQQWLMDNKVKKNSISSYMRILQSIYNKATDGMETPKEKPFSKVYRGIAKTRKRATTISVIQKIRSLDVNKGLINMGKDPKRKTFPILLTKVTMARDLFIFCYCARGMAFVDVAYLKKQDVRNGIIRYRRRKTGQVIEVALEPIMQDIIDRYAEKAKGTPYLFPILPQADEEKTYQAYRSALRTYNCHLKLLSQMLDEDVNLSSYVARHSWASNMHEMNMPLSVISQGLGHDSELTTQIYIKSLESNKIHNANRTFINRIFSSPFLSHERDFLRCKTT